MITLDQAAKLGYVIDEGPPLEVTRDGVHLVTVVSDCPLFFALRHIAELEGDDLAAAPVDAKLISQLTGEAYTDPPPPPAPVPPDLPVSASIAVQTAVTAAMATVSITSPNLTAQQKQQIQDQVTAAVQAVVDKAGLT